MRYVTHDALSTSVTTLFTLGKLGLGEMGQNPMTQSQSQKQHNNNSRSSSHRSSNNYDNDDDHNNNNINDISNKDKHLLLNRI